MPTAFITGNRNLKVKPKKQKPSIRAIKRNKVISALRSAISETQEVLRKGFWEDTRLTAKEHNHLVTCLSRAIQAIKNLRTSSELFDTQILQYLNTHTAQRKFKDENLLTAYAFITASPETIQNIKECLRASNIQISPFLLLMHQSSVLVTPDNEEQKTKLST